MTPSDSSASSSGSNQTAGSSPATSTLEGVPAFSLPADGMRRLASVASTTPATPEGRIALKNFAEDLFASCFSVSRGRCTADIAEAQRHRARLEADRSAVDQRRAAIPPERLSGAVSFQLPQGWVARTAFGFWLALWISVSVFTVYNTRNLIAVVLQDPIRALCFAAPLLILPVSLKLILERDPRSVALLKSPVMALVLLFAGAAFAWQLGEAFGRTRSIEEIAAAGIGRDWRTLLWASIALETIGGLVLYSHIAAFVNCVQRFEDNPDYTDLTTKLTALDERLNTETRIIHKRESELEAWNKSQANLVQIAFSFQHLFMERAQLAAANASAIEKLHQLWVPPVERPTTTAHA